LRSNPRFCEKIEAVLIGRPCALKIEAVVCRVVSIWNREKESGLCVVPFSRFDLHVSAPGGITRGPSNAVGADSFAADDRIIPEKLRFRLLRKDVIGVYPSA
jgi:hypothetical protein